MPENDLTNELYSIHKYTGEDLESAKRSLYTEWQSIHDEMLAVGNTHRINSINVEQFCQGAKDVDSLYRTMQEIV
jgi:hypothetical protein